MINYLRTHLWSQFGASIDALKNSVELWPEERWETDRRFFYMTYHTLVFLDYFSTYPAGDLSSPLPFTFTEPAHQPEGSLDDVIPNRIYSKNELLDYLHALRSKCKALIEGLTEEKLAERWVENDSGMSYGLLEILLYNMRHVQHHAAQLNMMLRNKGLKTADWVFRAEGI